MSIKNARLRLMLFITLIISITIIIRIIYLASLSPEDYTILYNGEYSINRGDIYDKRGNLLAVSDELNSVYANPYEIKNKKKTTDILSRILNIPQNEISSKLKQKKNFIWIKRQISHKQSQIIKQLNIAGIGLKKEYKRFYPNKNLASHILGFTNIDSKGIEGIEKSMDQYLLANIGNSSFNTNSNNMGLNIYLTIDMNIQALAEHFLKEKVIKENADSGSFILMDAKSGEIICMANAPDFDPNLYQNYDQQIFRNYSIFNQFEPGSVLKIFTIASLLDKHYINSSNYYFCDGEYNNNGIKINCTGNHGSVNYFDIIKYSCNDGMIQASRNIKPDQLFNYLKSFGFGMRTAIELPGEQPGILRDINDWNYRSMFSIPLGQEISVNALQIVRAATTFVNRGIMIEPYIVQKITNQDNKIIKETKQKTVRKVISQETASKVLKSMKTATEPGGTVDKLYLEGVQFSSKSGTGEIFDTQLKKYSDQYFTSSLLVIFPFKNPRYIAYIVFHRPKGVVKWGGVLGAETLNPFLHSITGYLNFYPENNQKIPVQNLKILCMMKQIKISQPIPDFTGMKSSDVIKIFSSLDISVRTTGNGLIHHQYPNPGTILQKNSEIILYLKN